jgi:hypothetical protein
MPSRIQQIFGVCVFRYSEDEEVLRGVQDAVDVIGEAGAQNAGLVATPMGSLDHGFFKLRTGLAGEMLQKFINYRLRVAISATLLSWLHKARRCAISSASRTAATQSGFLPIWKSLGIGSRRKKATEQPASSKAALAFAATKAKRKETKDETPDAVGRSCPV